jgi:hypothetical protein
VPRAGADPVPALMLALMLALMRALMLDCLLELIA